MAVVAAVVAIGLTVVSTVVSLRQMNKAKNSAKQSYTYGEGALTTSTSNTTPVPIIYGTVRVAGNQIYSRLTNKDKTIMKVVAFCEGPVHAIKNFKIDDLEPENKKFKNVSYNLYAGSPGQLLDHRIVGATQEDKAKVVGGLKDIAYVALQADANENLSGSFSVSADIEGAMVKVYSDVNDLNTYVVQHSSNPAWCILDFMTRYNGCGMSMSQIDLQSFMDAAEYFDNPEHKYSLNLCLDTQKSRLEWINDMMDCCRSNLVYHNGKYAIQVEKSEEVVQSYTEEDVNDVTVWFSPLNEVPDIYRVTYIDPDNEWTKVQAEASKAPSTYLRKQPLISEIELMGVTNFDQASRLAWFYLNQSLTCQTYVEFKTDQRALDRSVGDVITLSDPILGFENKKFRVVKVEDAQDESIKLTCREYSDEIYTEVRNATNPVINVTKLDYNAQVPPTVIYEGNTQYYNVNDDGTIVSDIILNVDYEYYAYSSYLKVYYRKVGEQDWGSYTMFDLSASNIKNLTIHNMEVYETYEFKFQIVSTSHIFGEASISPEIYITGNKNAPAMPTGFIAKRTYGGIRLSWDVSKNLTYVLYKVNVDGTTEFLTSTTSNEYVYNANEGEYKFSLHCIDNLDLISPKSYVEFSLERPKVTNISTSNRYRDLVDGVARYDVAVSWTPPNNEYYKRSEVWYKTSNVQTEYAYLEEYDDVPLDELNLYTGDWISGGYGSNSVILSQAVVGDKYLIAVCAQDEYGGTDSPEKCPQVVHEVILKSAIPNTPGNLSTKFTNKCNIAWEEVVNSDILYYEVRLDDHFGQEEGLLLRTSELSTDVDLNFREGYLFVYAVSTSDKHSAPAKIYYSKPKPKAPSIDVVVGSLGTVNLLNDEVPEDCNYIHYEIVGAINSYSENFGSKSNLINVKPDIYKVKACFVDMFGEGEYSTEKDFVVTSWIDGALIKEASITKEALDEVTSSALDGAVEDAKNALKDLDDLSKSVYTKTETDGLVQQQISSYDEDMKANTLSQYITSDTFNSTVATIEGDIATNSSSITQLSSGISLSVSGSTGGSSINLSENTLSIDTKLLQVGSEGSLTTISDGAITTNMINSKAVNATKLDVEELSAITAKIGTLRTRSEGARVEIKDDLIEIYDSNNVLRVRLGIWEE